VLVEQLNRRQTTNTFWMVNARTGAPRTLFVERDSAWIDIVDGYNGWNAGPAVHWTKDGSQFVYISERDGWRHAYLVSRDGSMRLITNGAYDVMRVALIDMAGGWLYYYASPENPTRMFLYRSRIDGSGAPERLTPVNARGIHDYNLSPTGRLAIHSWTEWGKPRVFELVQLPSHATVRVLQDNKALAAKLASLKLGESEFFRVDNGSGEKLDAWMIRPPNFDPTKKYPVLFYVYGEPWDMTVRDAYDGNYLWHNLLAQQGYIIVSVDNRGTPAPRGRAWRKALKNQVGALRVREFTAAAQQVAQRPYVDASRMAIWGWSGGGSSTLMMMFRAPDVFKVGIAVAPMADVRYYDTVYQERYLGLPSTDSAAYHDASAADFASGLKGNLLVIHGTGDDNVHYQATERLINKLVAANKPFEMMSYPNRTHGIYEGPGTTVHLYSLMQRYLHEHLPAGPR
jgi:dipeptidyl-peptidase-4